MTRRRELSKQSTIRLVLGLAIACLLVGCFGDTDRLAKSPFEHVAEGFPEIIPLSEEPSADDEQAFNEYWALRREVFEWSMNQTILANSPQVEKDLFEAIDDGRYAVARKLADQLLRNDSDSLIGLYAIANVEAFAEGDMAYALNSIRRARNLTEAMGQINPRDPIGQEWYIRTLWTELFILIAMDRSNEVIILAERIEDVYAPVPWLKTFSLIKLERFDDARAEIAKYQDLGTFDIEANNSLMVIQDKLKSRESSLLAAREMCERFPERRVLQYNLGLAAISSANFGEAEQSLFASAMATASPMNATPYVPLSSLFVQQGRFPEALDAIKMAQVERGERDAYTLHDDEATTNMAIASVLLAYNEPILAMRFAQRAIDLPDRAASTSNAERDLRISSDLILWTIQKYQRAELQEKMSIGAVPTMSSLAQVTSLQVSQWATHQRFVSELSRSHVIDLVSPYKPGAAGIETQVQSWHRFMLFDLVPLGVLEVALYEAERAETQPWIPAYLHALHAGIRLRKNDYTESLRFANDSLNALPPRAEKVYRSFVSAIAGEAAWQLDKNQEAIGYWTTTLRDFPQAFRLLDIRIPIRLSHGESDLERRIAATLASSSRFIENELGFEVVVGRIGDEQLAIEMFRSDRSRHLELEVPISSDEGFIEATVEQFHQEFFQPLVELTQADLGSLDGSPIAARARREVDQLFSDLIELEDDEESPATD